MTLKVVLITGCTSGIGRESALLLARQGHRVFATGRNLEALSDALRLELAPFGIDVVIIQPGAIRSEFEQRGDREFAKLQGDVGVYQKAMSGFQSRRQEAFNTAPNGAIVARTIATAVGDRQPKIRYVVPLKARFFLAVFTWLPDFATDAIKRTVFALVRA